MIISPKMNFDFGKSIKSLPQPDQQVKMTIEKDKKLAIFTDGSKIPTSKSVGTTAVCPELNISKIRSMNQKASIFTAECIAISDAMDIAIQNKSTKN